MEGQPLPADAKLDQRDQGLFQHRRGSRRRRRKGRKAANPAWEFNAEDAQETKLPATMPKQMVGSTSYMLPPDGTALQGALWFKSGFSHVGNVNNNDHCHCTGNSFDLDGFARVFAPDSGRFRVGVLDANGNEVASFGGYGNQDFCGPDSYVLDAATKRLRLRTPDDPKDLVSPFAKPAIPFGWIVGITVTDRFAYVDDVVNKRLLRVKLDYAASETVPIP